MEVIMIQKIIKLNKIGKDIRIPKKYRYEYEKNIDIIFQKKLKRRNLYFYIFISILFLISIVKEILK